MPTPEEDIHAQRILSQALSSLKTSIERFPSPRLLEDKLYHDAWKRAVLSVEAIRIGFTPSLRFWPNRKPLVPLRDIRISLEKLLSNSEFVATTERIRFRLNPIPSRVQPEMDTLQSRDLSVPSAILHIIDLIDSFDRQPTLRFDSSIDIQALKRVIPGQKISPVQFAVANGRLIIAEQKTLPHAEDTQNVDIAKRALLERGERLIDELQRSNCDRRLLGSFTELQRELSLGDNVIQIGLVNVACEAMYTAFEKELPDAMVGLLMGHTRGVSMYLAQYPEWQQFSEKAAAAELSIQDIQRIATVAKKLVADLEANPQIADPAVPRVINALQQLINDPAKASKRAAFAVLRTIENLISRAFQYGVDFLEMTTTKTLDGLSTVTSKVAIVALMSLALGTAIDISPLTSKINDTAWIKTAVEVVQKQIETLSK